MKPLTLAEVNAAIDRANDRYMASSGEPEGPWGRYESIDQPYTGCLRMALRAKGVDVGSYSTGARLALSAEIDRLADNLGAMPIGFAIARVNRILETIPEPEGVGA